MIKKITILFFISFLILIGMNKTNAQSNIKYGDDYIVFEAEDTNTPLGNNWKVIKEGDTNYLDEDFYNVKASSPSPMNKTYFQYTGPWQGANSELEYNFTCPKTGTYQLAMRMSSPLEEYTGTGKKFTIRTLPDGTEVKWELADARNDIYVKMEGNFTSGNAKHTESDLRTFHKMFGRGPNRWGTCINLEHNGSNGAFYNFIEGETYTFYLKGRSNSTIIDYIAFYDTSYLAHNINNQGPDLAIQLPEEIRPYETLIALSLTPNPGNVRAGTNTTKLNVITTPTNANNNVTWSSSNAAIISIDANGILTAKGNVAEKATITATSLVNNTLIATSEITIIDFFDVDVASLNVTPSAANIVVGGTITFTTAVLPNNADDKSITWSSLNEEIATVDQNGVITALSAGIVTIRATSNENTSIYGEATLQIGENIPQSIAFDDIDKYRNRTYRSEGTMEVTLNYHAGSFKTIKDPIILKLRHIHKDNGWNIVKDITLNLDETVGKESGTITVDIPLTGVTPTADLSTDDFYYLFVKATNSNGDKKTQGIEPIIILEKTLSTKDILSSTIFRTYPNPTKNAVFIETNFAENLFANIYNINSKLVKSKEISKIDNKINTSNFRPGVYFIQLKSKNKTIATKKLIILK
ncbi:Ig-like domain-containing protein [Polaribacter sp. Q13]|uniref:T9SS type A sorting domain-containing protein n=1 Tax=Polaribacter sp. Q13 TaxID=2806551 RepID=UPI00193BD40F|nr:Ig-like domain-containing protein [Polaribacter sp. Q13]QVY65037.1 Ig-like domain-containing protein [Polaribacter sp. Q13]